MAHYSIEKMISLWEQEKLTPEQVIGQILLLLASIIERLQKLEATRRR